MATQTLQLGEAASERTLSLAGRTFQRSDVEQSESVKTADKSLSTYFDPTIKEKATFRITFFQLAGIDADTPDNQTGRDNLKVEKDKFIPLNFIVINEAGGSETFSVKFIRYQETYNRVLGDQGQQIWRYNITMELQEV